MGLKKRTYFVPRAVFGASFGGVVPACVALGIQACSNSTPPLGVAAVAYCCFEAGTNDGDASDATEDTTDATEDAANDVASDAPGDGADQ